MARGRFISRNIPFDRKINLLSSDTCRLAFTWIITMTDCEGRLIGEPELLASLLFPRREDVTPAMIEGFIREWARAGFVVWYIAPDEDRYLALRNFKKHQVGLRKERESKSAIPPPEDCQILEGKLPEEPAADKPVEDQTDSENCCDETEQEDEEPSEPEVSSASKTWLAYAQSPSIRAYSLRIKQPGQEVRDQLLKAEKVYGIENVLEAIFRASQHKARSWAYVHSILKNMATASSNPPNQT